MVEITAGKNTLVVARGEGSGGMGKIGEGKWEKQVFSYGISKSQE